MYSIESDIDQESLICLLDTRMTKKLFDETKSNDEMRQSVLSKMFKVQVFQLYEKLYQKEKLEDLRILVNNVNEMQL